MNVGRIGGEMVQRAIETLSMDINVDVSGFTSQVLEPNSNLRECPFCKGEAMLLQVHFTDGDIWFNPQCVSEDGCHGGWNENYPTREDAVKAWNNRKN